MYYALNIWKGEVSKRGFRDKFKSNETFLPFNLLLPTLIMTQSALIGHMTAERIQELSTLLWKKRHGSEWTTYAEIGVVGTIKTFDENSVCCFNCSCNDSH
jgi:hypothetical protein